MAKKQGVPERGVGSNQHADKPPRTLTDEELAAQQQRASAAAKTLQDFVSSEEIKLLDSGRGSSPAGSADRYESILRHPGNHYEGRQVSSVTEDEIVSEWDSIYPQHVLVDGEPKVRQWGPEGSILVGYEYDAEDGSPKFVVSTSSVSPPEELLSHYGIGDQPALIFAESDRIIVGPEGELDDSDPDEPMPDVPAIPYSFLPAATQDRIREILNFHVQIGPIWEAHYDEANDTWNVLVKYGDRFQWETWPPERLVN